MIKSLYLLPIFSKVTFAMCPMNFWSASKFSALAIILYGTSQYPHLLIKGLQCLSKPHLFGDLHFYAKMWMGCLLKCCFHILILSCLKLSIRECFKVHINEFNLSSVVVLFTTKVTTKFPKKLGSYLLKTHSFAPWHWRPKSFEQNY